MVALAFYQQHLSKSEVSNLRLQKHLMIMKLTIDKLPSELLLEILSHFDDEYETFQVTIPLVCRRFRDLITYAKRLPFSHVAKVLFQEQLINAKYYVPANVPLSRYPLRSNSIEQNENIELSDSAQIPASPEIITFKAHPCLQHLRLGKTKEFLAKEDFFTLDNIGFYDFENQFIPLEQSNFKDDNAVSPPCKRIDFQLTWVIENVYEDGPEDLVRSSSGGSVTVLEFVEDVLRNIVNLIEEEEYEPPDGFNCNRGGEEIEGKENVRVFHDLDVDTIVTHGEDSGMKGTFVPHFQVYLDMGCVDECTD